jgi:hypothetical protein
VLVLVLVLLHPVATAVVVARAALVVDVLILGLPQCTAHCKFFHMWIS